MANLHPRGSEWNKWDLHVHTPKSFVQEYGSDTEEVWKKFIADLGDTVEKAIAQGKPVYVKKYVID